MMPKFLRKVLKPLKPLRYENISPIFQNIFRTRFETDRYIAKTHIVAKTHEKTFGEYKNKHAGQDVVLIATGPSLNKYKPISNVINIGVNKAILYDKVHLDYFFAQDYHAVSSFLPTLVNHPDVVKFFGIMQIHPFGYKEEMLRHTIIPESCFNLYNARKFYLYTKRPLKNLPFETDIDKTWIADGGSIALSAVQFALFTNPRRIYLVGCDCSSGYFDGSGGIDCSYIIKPWTEMKQFADIYYPETEIISVNPIGLKGIFKDLYQE